MSVDGREIASLDFPNLIGGPLNAIVEAQAKSAITSANFIKEVAFDAEGKAIHTEFKYDRKGPDGRTQTFTLSVPFLTMLPIPYITVEQAEIEFNAKITSTRENSTASNFSGELEAGAGGNMWGMRANLQAKTAMQKKSQSSEKEQRSFDMRVLVRVRNADIPPGTERLLNILENAIEERGGPVSGVSGAIESVNREARELVVTSLRGLGVGLTLTINGSDLGSITGLDATRRAVVVSEEPPATLAAGDTFEAQPPTSE